MNLLNRFLIKLLSAPLAIAPHSLDALLKAAVEGKGKTDLESAAAIQGLIVHRRLVEENRIPAAPEGTAVISVTGPLTNRSRGFMSLFGFQTYQDIRREFLSALDDPGVEHIVFDIDSPGGEVAGLFDLADFIHASRGKKRITAYANETAFSAAYLLASAADEVVLGRTAGVGSVGVLAVHVDQSKYDEKAGLKYTAVYAGARKNDFSRHEPLSEEAEERLRNVVEKDYALFVKAVARNRALSEEGVRKTEAGIFWGDEALAAGFADRVVTDFLENLENKEGTAMKDDRTASAGQGAKTDEPTPRTGQEAIEEKGAKVVVELDEAAREKMRKEEIERQAGITSLCESAKRFFGAESCRSVRDELILSGAGLEEAKAKLFDKIVEEFAEDEITSTVGPVSVGGANPVVAEAQKRAGGK